MHLLIVIHALLAVFALEAVAMLAAWLLRQREYALTAFLPYLVSVATGLLLATALLWDSSSWSRWLRRSCTPEMPKPRWFMCTVMGMRIIHYGRRI